MRACLLIFQKLVYYLVVFQGPSKTNHALSNSQLYRTTTRSYFLSVLLDRTRATKRPGRIYIRFPRRTCAATYFT